MVNSSKTPTGKAKKGQIAIRLDSKVIKACFPREPFPGEKNQVKRATGISDMTGWEAKAEKLRQRLQIEMEDWKLTNPDGTFNENKYREILVDQKLRPNLKLVESAGTSGGQLPPKPELSILEIWDMYCEYRKHDLAITTYHQEFRGIYYRAIKQAVDSVGENNSIDIHNWLLKNRNSKTVKEVLSQLSKAYRLAMKQKLVSFDPYEGMSEDIQVKRKPKVINQLDDVNNDSDALDRTKAYTWDEVELILQYVANSPRISCWYSYLKFKFLTGCRPGEAAGLWWVDVKWENECIVFDRSYDYRLGIHKPTKNESARIFPMPKDGGLWNLLKSIPQGEPNDTVFKSKSGKKISSHVFQTTWLGREKSQKGIITELIRQGKLSKYLPPYNTRHTFINHQINDVGIAQHIVNDWCEHSERVSKQCYRQTDTRVVPGYGESVASNQQVQQQSELDLLKEQLRQQQEMIEKLLQDRDNLKS
ncbi:MAG: site-specific integrase [Nostoc sp.]|uniref:site-specific integrase n=1 Tax=Nostoc sp. TaxID=1180 RepID=UPI002FF8B305